MIRLYVTHDLHEAAAIAAGPDQVHYLSQVMRARPGDELLVFNGRDGEWLTRVVEISRRGARLEVLSHGAHLVAIERPDEVTALIEQHLEALR